MTCQPGGCSDPADETRARLDEIVPRCYDELRKLAAKYLRGEREGHTLQATAVVHEAYLRLRRSRKLQTDDRGAFLVAASATIRRLLIDHARRHNTLRRGSGWGRVNLDAALLTEAPQSLDLLGLDEAMTGLGRVHPRSAKVVELRFFCGMHLEEIGAALGVSRRVIQREWALGKAWLHRELTRADDGRR